MVCLYWILKLRLGSCRATTPGLAAAESARSVLWSSEPRIFHSLDYFLLYRADRGGALRTGSADEQNWWRELLATHREQLREWAENYPPTFADKHALVSAEIARIEGRDLDAMRLYEEAIRSARENGFIQNEGVAYEVAAGSMRRAASRPSPTPISGMPALLSPLGSRRQR